MVRLVLEGYLYNSASNYLIVAQDDGRSIEIDDTLIRSRFLGMKVKISIELLPVDRIRLKYGSGNVWEGEKES